MEKESVAMRKCTKCGDQLSNNQYKKHEGLCPKCRPAGNPSPTATVAEVKAEAEAKAKAEAETKDVVEEAEKVVEEATAGAIDESDLGEDDKAIYEAIKSMKDGEAKEKALARFGKLKAQDDKSGQAKRFAEFDGEVKTELPKWLSEMAKKHNVSLLGRKITVAFPLDGAEAKHTHTPIGSRNPGNSGGSRGFSTHGKVEYEGAEHQSLHKLAEVLNLQYEGRRTAFQVFTEPLEKDTKAELPYKFTVEEREGKPLLVTKVKK